MRKVFVSVLIFVLAFFSLSATSVSAKVLANKNGNVTVAKNEVINDDVFIGAQTAEIDGTVNGDLFIGAQSVKLNGTVSGSVYVGAQSIIVAGAKIGGSLFAGGQTVDLDKNTTVGGSVLAGAEALSIDSHVKRSVYAGAGNLTIGGNAVIGKDLYYAENKNVQANISGKVAGNTYKSEMNPPQTNAQMEVAKKQVPAVLGAFRFGSALVSFIGALIIGLLFIKLFGKHFSGAVGFVKSSFWKSFGIGFLIVIAFIPALLLLVITIVGIPLAGLAILMFALLSYFSQIVVGAAFGNYLSQKLNWKMSVGGAFVFGLLIIDILKLIPVVGFLTGIVVLWTGLGALTLHAASESKQ